MCAGLEHAMELEKPEHGGEGGAAPVLPLKSRGKGGRSSLFLLSTDKIFHILFLYSFFSQARPSSILRNLSHATKCNRGRKHMLSFLLLVLVLFLLLFNLF